ncbi:ExbD/TolR family protein [Bdellovibrio bacteriovorus]|uniref:Adventurous gliding motility protein S n=1 Tax=Bdellovibrio bacteriovorus str. Tiberius TaxID=1069642 RepID=K7ZF52_BDEBC|nr:biopolymer transporter ExbD [Bdellovibrio bacteriovorus]AFY01167.1 adventurous gliding motility protein S [Bdellovibrio bacteriovorus str. Tiberius]
MSRRRRYEPKTKKNSTFGLNITSMTDMFTIMLVFLLQSYSTSDVQIIPENNLRLPTSASMTNATESIKLSLSGDALKIDQTKIADVKNADFLPQDLEDKDSNFIKPLFQELDKIAKSETEKDKAHVKEGRILLQADKDLPYATLRKVMYTASMAGFPQLKLVTMVGE